MVSVRTIRGRRIPGARLWRLGPSTTRADPDL